MKQFSVLPTPNIDLMAREEIADAALSILVDLEKQGIQLPAGWRNQTITFQYLDDLIEIAKIQIAHETGERVD